MRNSLNLYTVLYFMIGYFFVNTDKNNDLEGHLNSMPTGHFVV